MTQKIIFHSAKSYNDSNEFHPSPTKMFVPDWFSKSSRNWTDKDGTQYKDAEGNNLLSFKACPALMDAFVTGYNLLTPCDIHFYKVNGRIERVIDPQYADFCDRRNAIADFVVPYGYEEDHFHWFPNWMPELPEGYSAIYINPLNRFDLPFFTVSGIIDNDKMNTPGLMPFFIKKGFIGTVNAGTPYAQIIPFKRDSWEMDKVLHSEKEIIDRHNLSAQKFRIPGGGAYKKTVWSRKDFS